MRVLAIDLGSKRIGVAVSDRTGTLASPYEVVVRSGDLGRDHRRLLELVTETEAERVIVGLPLSLDGSVGPAARGVLDEVERLRAVFAPVPVEAVDERLTTVTADRLLAERGVSSRGRRKTIDQAAAAVLLQSWLESPSATDARAEAGREREEPPPDGGEAAASPGDP